MKKLSLCIMILLIAACASKNDPTEDFDENLKSRTSDDKESVGLKDDTVYIKKKVYLEERLFKMKRQIEDLESTIYGRSKRDPGGVWESLRECRARLTDPRVGGGGMPEKMERWEKISETEEDYVFKVDKNKNIIGYSEEELATRLERMKKHKRLLEDRYDEFKEKTDVCEAKYKAALVKHGLNPEDTKVEGEWVQGPDGYKVWRMKRPKTDDPEELMRRKYEREKKTQSTGQ